MADRALVSMAQQFTGLPMDSLIGGPLNAAAKANAAMAATQTKFMLDTCFNKLQRKGIDPNSTASPPTAEYMWQNKTTGAVTYAATAPSADDEPIVEYKPIMITMSLTRGVLTPGNPGDPNATPPVAATDTSIQQFTTTFDLPILTIIPINSLGVDNVDITFEMEVNSSFSEEQQDTSETDVHAEASFEAKIGFGPFSATIKGSASYDHKDSSTHSTHYQKSNSAKYTVNVHAGQLPVPKGVNTIITAFTNAIEPIEMPALKS